MALMALDQWLEAGLKLEEGKYGLGFPFMYLLLTGTMGLKVSAHKFAYIFTHITVVIAVCCTLLSASFVYILDLRRRV